MNCLLRSARSLRIRAKAFISAFIFLFSAVLFCIPCGADRLSRTNFLRTSFNPDYYSLFEIDGNVLHAKGKYSGDRIKKLFFVGEEDFSGSYKMKIAKDGSYEAEMTLPDGYRYTSVVVSLASGASFGYRINCDNGFYFPMNGLEAENKTVFDKIIQASPESAAYYLSPTADGDEISSVLEQLKKISDTETGTAETGYEKARALAAYVAENYYYDCDAREHSVTEKTIALSEVLKTRRTVCAGFANLYCALLQAQGIDAINIKGGSIGGEVEYENLTDGVQNHEFTAFWYEEQQRWVWVDACWDGSGNYKNGEIAEGKLHEKFFDITDEALSLDHRADYAERRSFFSAEPKAETEILAETEESQPQITSAPPEAIPPQTEKNSAENENPAETAKNEENNTPLIIAVIALGAAVVITAAWLVVRMKNNRP